jgi:hypothetical protein
MFLPTKTKDQSRRKKVHVEDLVPGMREIPCRFSPNLLCCVFGRFSTCGVQKHQTTLVGDNHRKSHTKKTPTDVGVPSPPPQRPLPLASLIPALRLCVWVCFIETGEMEGNKNPRKTQVVRAAICKWLLDLRVRVLLNAFVPFLLTAIESPVSCLGLHTVRSRLAVVVSYFGVSTARRHPTRNKKRSGAFSCEGMLRNLHTLQSNTHALRKTYGIGSLIW